MKKVLHLALVSPIENDGAIDLGFMENGYGVHRIDWQRYVDPSGAAIEQVGWPDVVFFQGQGTSKITAEALDTLRAGGAFVINWTGDVRNDVDWYAKMAPHVDLTLFTNLTDVEKMRALGFKADYLQVGFDHRVFNLGEVEHERKGIVFLGNHYGTRFPQSAFRKEMVERMKAEFGDEFQYYGNGWGKDVPHASPLKEVEIYRRALVAIGADHYIRPYFASDRLLRSQACGAMVLQQWYPGLVEEHPLVVDWRTLDELVETCRSMLLSPNKCIAMGGLQSQYVQQNCRWSNRVQQLETLIEKYR
jgi:hypothetical protein